MTSFFTRTLAVVALSLITVFATAISQPARAQDSGQQAQEKVKATYGAWDIVCSATKKSECFMRQIGKTADGKKVMLVLIRKLDGVKTKDGKPVPAAIQITTPLGTSLRSGVHVQIDSKEPRTGLFEVCLPAGCMVREAMSEEFLSSLKAGNVAKMSFAVLRQGELKVDISLKGFTKAFSTL